MHVIKDNGSLHQRFTKALMPLVVMTGGLGFQEVARADQGPAQSPVVKPTDNVKAKKLAKNPEAQKTTQAKAGDGNAPPPVDNSPIIDIKFKNLLQLADQLEDKTTAAEVKAISSLWIDTPITTLEQMHQIFDQLLVAIKKVDPKLKGANEIKTELGEIASFITQYKALATKESALNQLAAKFDIDPDNPVLNDEHKKLIAQWSRENQAWLNRTGANRELEANAGNDIKALSMLFVHAGDVTVQRNLLHYFWLEGAVNNENPNLNVATLIKSKIDEQNQVAPNMVRGLLGYEQDFLRTQASTFNRLGFQDLTKPDADLTTDRAFARFGEAIVAFIKDIDPKALAGTNDLDALVKAYTDREVEIISDPEEKEKEKVLRQFDKLLQDLKIASNGSGYQAAKFKDLPEKEQQIIAEWVNQNRAWLALTGADFQLGEGDEAANEVDFKKFIEQQYFDFLLFTKLLTDINKEGADLDKALLEHAKLTKSIMRLERARGGIKRGLLRHEAYWVGANEAALKKLGFEGLLDKKVKYFDKPEHRAMLVKALDAYIASKEKPAD